MKGGGGNCNCQLGTCTTTSVCQFDIHIYIFVTGLKYTPWYWCVVHTQVLRFSIFFFSITKSTAVVRKRDGVALTQNSLKCIMLSTSGECSMMVLVLDQSRWAKVLVQILFKTCCGSCIHVHCIDIRYLIGFKTRPATPTVGCKLNNTHHFHRISSNDFIDNSLPPPPLARRRCNNPIIPQLHTCTPSKRRLLA